MKINYDQYYRDLYDIYFIPSKYTTVEYSGLYYSSNYELVENQDIIVRKPHTIDISHYEIIEDPVFYMRYDWSWNYHIHFIENLPNLFVFLHLKKQYPTLKLCIQQEWIFLYEELFPLLGLVINPSSCIVSHYNTIYLWKHCLLADYLQVQCCNSTKNIDPLQLFFMDWLRSRYTPSVPVHATSTKKICVLRKNTLAGKKRYIVNETELIDHLRPRGYDFVYFEELRTLKEKVEALWNVSELIMPLGANMVNMFFNPLSSIQKLTILVPNGCQDYSSWIFHQLSTFCPNIPNVEKILCEQYAYDGEGDVFNRPYVIPLDFLKG